MNRKQKLALLNGIIKGFRPVNDVFADWPAKYYYVNEETDPPTFEDDDGAPATAREIYKQLRTYPKVKVRPVSESVKDIKNFFRSALKRMDEEEEEDDFEEAEEEDDFEQVEDDGTDIEENHQEETDERPLKPWQIPREAEHQLVPLPVNMEPPPIPLPRPEIPRKPDPPPKMYHIL